MFSAKHRAAAATFLHLRTFGRSLGKAWNGVENTGRCIRGKKILETACYVPPHPLRKVCEVCGVCGWRRRFVTELESSCVVWEASRRRACLRVQGQACCPRLRHVTSTRSASWWNSAISALARAIFKLGNAHVMGWSSIWSLGARPKHYWDFLKTTRAWSSDLRVWWSSFLDFSTARWPCKRAVWIWYLAISGWPFRPLYAICARLGSKIPIRINSSRISLVFL